MTVMDTSYVPLLLRSNYSLLTGTASIDDILQKAIKFGISSVALTDTNNLYAAIPFYKKAKVCGIKPIIGTELILNQNNVSDKKQRIFLLARDGNGYSNICKIISRVNGCGFRVPSSKLKNNLHSAIHTDHLSPPNKGELRGGLKVGTRRTCKSGVDENLQSWIHIFAEHQDGIYFLTENADIAEQLAKCAEKTFVRLIIIRPDQNITTQRHIYSKAKEIGVDVVGSCDIYILEKDDYTFHKLLVAIKNGIALDNRYENQSEQMVVDNWRLAVGKKTRNSQLATLNSDLQSSITNPANYFRSPQEMATLFADCPELIKNAQSVAKDCNVEIPMGNFIFPKYSIPNDESALCYLHKLCIKGLKWRYSQTTKEITDRLNYELDVIGKLGFPEYFLVVGDIVRFARSQDIPVVGRGSGASSIVAYVLGITNVDPIKYNLCFERFMHLLRNDYPDLDIDLCWRKRDDVINHVYDTYGSDHVAMISTHNTFQPRSAFREVAKAFGMPNNLVNRYSKFIPHHIKTSISEFTTEIPVFRDLSESNASFGKIVQMADKLNGYPRHLGIHSGGIVISDKPIDSYVPLEEATKGIVITQYDMRTIEDIGLIKIDLLGNRALSTIRETVNLVKKTYGITIDLEKVPDKELQTVKFLKNGHTLGCFQIESPGMRNLLKMLQVSSIEKTIASLSLIRPGPATGGLKERYVRRARGLEKTVQFDPRLKDVLGNSFGIMLYEEDAIRSASAITGVSLAQGDEFRREIAKAKTKEDLNKIAEGFIKHAERNGVNAEVAYSVGKHIANFARFTFCKAHAAGYGFIAYQGAYLKAHYPVEFIVGVINNHQGMYEKRVHIEEARRMGIIILHPCVNRSEQEYTVEDRKLRVGLMQVKGLSLKTIAQIKAKRIFLSLTDFLCRVKTSHKEAESLIYSGAFDFTCKTRPELMWELETTVKKKTNLILISPIVNMPSLNDYSEEKKFWDEYKVLEIFVNHHPMIILKRNVPTNGLIDSSSLHNNAGKKVKILGILDAIRKTDTKRNEKMMFVTLEDENGIFEVTLFPAVYRKYSYLLKNYGPYIVEGKVENQYGAITITAEKILPWDY